MRSYSRNAGSTSQDSDTISSGWSAFDDLAGAQLVRRVDEREQVADRDRLDPGRRRARRRPAPPRASSSGTRTSPLGPTRSGTSLRNAPGREEHRRFRLQHEIVHRAPHLAADFEHVLEPGGREEPDPGALSLQHGVGGDRRAVDEAGDRVRRDAPLPLHQAERFDRAGARVAGCRRDLRQPHVAGRIDADDVGERAADIDADRKRAGRLAHP